MDGKFVAYFRVSPAKHGSEGLGMEAQRQAVETYLDGGDRTLLASFAEPEPGIGKYRPQLEKAIALCLKENATLLIARLGRQVRNIHFITTLQETKVDFVALDNRRATPQIIHKLRAVAEKDARAFVRLIKAGFDAAKLRGVKFGPRDPEKAKEQSSQRNRERARVYAMRLAPIMAELKNTEITTLRGMAAWLNARGIKTPTGRTFASQSIKNLLERIKMLSEKSAD